MLTILNGDALEMLRTLPDKSAQMCVTSPPYFGLRKYKAGRLEVGREKTPAEYVVRLVEVFRELRRVLKDDGTLWLNLGDGYVSTPTGNRGTKSTLAGAGSPVYQETLNRYTESKLKRAPNPYGLNTKNLLGIPWRVAFALQEDGWTLRSEITWCKKVPMPESVTDRPTSATEKVFLFSKSGDTLLWRHRESNEWADSEPPPDYVWRKPKSREESKTEVEGWTRINLWRGYDYFYDHLAVRNPPSDSWANDSRWKNGSTPHNEKNGYAAAGAQNPKQLHRMFDKRSRGHERNQPGIQEWDKRARHDQLVGSNMRNYWLLGPENYSGDHYATFPSAIPRKAILAGSRLGDTVLDPFAGSGTTGMVALELGRRATLIELNPEFIEQIKSRCNVTPGLALT